MSRKKTPTFVKVIGIGTILLLGVCVFLWWLGQPKLLDKLPDFPGAVFLKEAKTPFDSSPDSEIGSDCGGGAGFGAEEFRAYTADTNYEEVRYFYRSEANKKGYGFTAASGTYVDLDKSRLIYLKNRIVCLETPDRAGKIKYPSNAVMVLDPLVPAEAEIITKYLPGIKAKSIVFFVMRGFIYYG